MIFVTGIPRSGTTLTTSLLEAHGVALGEAGARDRLKENTEIRTHVVKALLRTAGACPLGQYSFVPTSAVPIMADLRDRVDAALGNADPRAYKDPKLALVWRAFAGAFPEAKWIICRRDRHDIARSLARTPFMHAHGADVAGWMAWLGEYETRLDEMKAYGLDLVETWPTEIVADPQAFAPVASHCGLAFDPLASRRLVDPALWHGGAKRKEAAA